jgi:TRAP-type C4-dicarboxylate transport system permease small subunit
MLLTWLALVGGAVAIGERAHFTVNLLVHHLPDRTQQSIYVFNSAVIAIFGGVLAWQGWRLAALNWSLGTPALGISLGWFYASTVAGGILIIVYALHAATLPPADPLDIRAD